MSEWSFLTTHARVLLCITTTRVSASATSPQRSGSPSAPPFGVGRGPHRGGLRDQRPTVGGIATRCNTISRWPNRRVRNARSATCSSSSAVVTSPATPLAPLRNGDGAPSTRRHRPSSFRDGYRDGRTVPNRPSSTGSPSRLRSLEEHGDTAISELRHPDSFPTVRAQFVQRLHRGRRTTVGRGRDERRERDNEVFPHGHFPILARRAAPGSRLVGA